MNTIRNAIESVRGTIADVISTPEVHSFTRAQVAALEETERADRIEHFAQGSIAKQNAKNVSALVSSLQFPVFKGGLNRGFKSYTRRAEESERQRLMSSKQELALRKANARMLSSGINNLGWPFIRNAGPKIILTDASKLAEEDERERRLADRGAMSTSRNNAALVSNLIRWDNYQRHTSAGLKRMTRNMEEKERKSRIADKAEQERASDLAWQTSGLIRRLGWPFYAQPTFDNKDYTRHLEEEEQKSRLNNSQERMVAKEIAGNVANIIHGKDTAYLSEKEKERRLQDTLEQDRHRAHSKRIASIFPSEMERKRLLADKAHTREAQLGAKKIADIVPHFMSVSSWNINRAVEKERSRRSNDVTAMAFAKFNAKKVSQLILDADTEKKTAWTNELEQERIRRMHDRVASDMSKKNARKVSKLILANKSNSTNAFESERARRVNDLNEQQVHRSNAKRVSELVRAKSVPSETVAINMPAAQAVRNIPVVPEVEAAPLSSAAPVEPMGVASRSIPMDSGMAAPLMQQPSQYYTPSPVYPASDYSSVPVMQQPAQYYSSPMPVTYSSPVMPMPVTYSSPSSVPVTYSSPSSLPITYSSSSAMPITYSTAPVNYLPGAAPAYVPYDSAVPSHLRVMSDRERKKLEKQASKHSRTATRQARRAEHDLAKAEKLHFRGKDARAMKYEGKAEQHNVAAKHHQAWAQELAADSLSHTLPTALPTVYRPAM